METRRRQKQIIESSLEIIKQAGIQKLTMKEIARNVGISEQAIYRHFDNKFAILCAIIEYFNQSLDRLFNKVPAESASINKLQKLLEIHLDYFTDHPAVAAVIFSEEIFKNDSSLTAEVKQTVEKRLEVLTELIQNGQQIGEIISNCSAKSLAMIIIGTLRMLITLWRLSDFSFNLKNEGEPLIMDLVNLIKLKGS